MGKNKSSGSKRSRAENDLVDFFLQENRFVSFKQLKKKLGNRIDKGDLYAAVHHLTEIRFLEERSNQFRRASKEEFLDGEGRTKGEVVEGVVDMTAQGHAYLVSEQLKTDAWIDKRNMLSAFDGDTVRVLITRKK